MDHNLFLRYIKFADSYKIKQPNIYYFLKSCIFQIIYKENNFSFPNQEYINMVKSFEIEKTKVQWNYTKISKDEYIKFLNDYYSKLNFNSLDLETCQLLKLITENLKMFGKLDVISNKRIIFLNNKINSLKNDNINIINLYDGYNTTKNKDEIDNFVLIKKQNEQYKKKIKELEDIIKELEYTIDEKDKIILKIKQQNNLFDAEIKEFKKKVNNNINNQVKKLQYELDKFKKYCLLPGEKLISIKFISADQKIDFAIITKNSEKFSKIETYLYEKYPNYKDTENYFLVKGTKINRHKTLEENKITNHDIITLNVIDE